MHARAPRQQGFTLIELLAVLAVLALAAGLVATRFGARQSVGGLQATAYELASRMRAARAAAIRHAASRTVVIDMANRMVTAGQDIAPFRIAEIVSIVSETSATERRTVTSAGIRFFPNGASTGGKIRLEAGQQAYEVRVNWLTGRIAVERTR